MTKSVKKSENELLDVLLVDFFHLWLEILFPDVPRTPKTYMKNENNDKCFRNRLYSHTFKILQYKVDVDPFLIPENVNRFS